MSDSMSEQVDDSVDALANELRALPGQHSQLGYGALAEAVIGSRWLAAHDAEVERLRGEVSGLEEALDEYQALHDANIVRFDALSARAKRAEADRDRFHDTIEVLDADYARLTAQLQAVRGAVFDPKYGHDIEWVRLNVRATLDAGAGGGK